MSLRKNGYEQRLVDKWQCHVSKGEAEEFLLRLREELNGDPYQQIRSVHYGDGSSRAPRLPKWAKDAFDGKMPYTDEEMQRWADDHRVPIDAVKLLGKNHHYLNAFRKICEGLDEDEKSGLRMGFYEALIDAAEEYEPEPVIWSVLSRCPRRQLQALGKWAAEHYANI